MSAPNASSSSSQLIAYTQDVDYTHTEGFKWFKSRYNVKNAHVTRNDPRGVYPSAETVYQAVKGLGCTLCSFDGLSLDDFISSGSVAARRCLKRLSSLGARGQLPSGSMLSTWRVLKQFAQLLPSG